MKRLLPYLLPILLLSCTSAQFDQTAAIADPLVSVALSGLGQAYGVPVGLTAPVVTKLQGEFWAMLKLKYAKQPIAQGSSIPAVGNAVAAQNPTTGQLITSLAKLGDPTAQSMLPAKVNIWNHKAYRYK